MNREDVVAQLAASSLTPFAQSCIVGLVINLTAALVLYLLWREEKRDICLSFWSASLTLSALRWVVTYFAITHSDIPAQIIAGLLAGGASTLTLTGAYSVVPSRRMRLRTFGTIWLLFFFAATLVGAWLAVLSIFYLAVSLVLWLMVASYFLRAYREGPLSAYRFGIVAALVNTGILSVGVLVGGRAFSTSIMLPLLALPMVIAFVMIAYQRALARAHDSEETVSTLLDTVPMPVVIARPPNGAVERINRAALEIFGRPASDFVGKSGVESGVIDPGSVRSTVYRQLAAGEDVRNQDMVYKRGPDDPIHVSVNATRAELRDGTRYIFTLYDLTDLRRVEAELQELNASLEQQVADRTSDLESFSYSVSHDLRAPLRAIDGYAALLHDELGSAMTPQAGEYVARIRAACRRMSDLIEAMINLAKLSRAALKPRLLDLSALARQSMDDIRRLDPTRQIEVRIEPWLRTVADADAVRIVIDNLLRNAWKYSSRTKGACVEVGSLQTEDGRQFYVRDNGAGFDMDQVDRLFQPFQRLHSVREFEGTGIGLATVAKIIRNHGGKIRAEGEVGKGACFYFNFGNHADTTQADAATP